LLTIYYQNIKKVLHLFLELFIILNVYKLFLPTVASRKPFISPRMLINKLQNKCVANCTKIFTNLRRPQKNRQARINQQIVLSYAKSYFEYFILNLWRDTMFEKSKQLFIAQWIYQQFFGKIIFAEQNEIYCLFITEKRANLNVHLSPPPPKLGTCQKLGNQHPEPPSFSAFWSWELHIWRQLSMKMPFNNGPNK